MIASQAALAARTTPVASDIVMVGGTFAPGDAPPTPAVRVTAFRSNELGIEITATGERFALSSKALYASNAGAMGMATGGTTIPAQDDMVGLRKIANHYKSLYPDQGGFKILLDEGRTFVARSTLEVPVGVGLGYAEYQGVNLRDGTRIIPVSNRPGIIVADPAVPAISLLSNSFVENLTLMYADRRQLSTLRDALDFAASQTGVGNGTGTGIIVQTRSPRGVRIKNVNLLGLQYGINSDSADYLNADYITGDCWRMVRIANGADQCAAHNLRAFGYCAQGAGVEPRTFGASSPGAQSLGGTVVAFNSGGSLGYRFTFTGARTDHEIQTGERITPTKPAVGRRSATRLSPTEIVFADVPWIASYSGLTDIRLAQVPQCGYGLTSLIRSASGKVQVTINGGPGNFVNVVPGHLLNLMDDDLGDNSLGGYVGVLSVSSDSRTFELDLDYDDGYATLPPSRVSLNIMPLGRRSDSYMLDVDALDSGFFSGGAKTGSGVRLNGNNCHVKLDYEGTTTGESGVIDANSIGIDCLPGSSGSVVEVSAKICGIGVRANTPGVREVRFMACQASGSRATWDFVAGNAEVYGAKIQTGRRIRAAAAVERVLFFGSPLTAADVVGAGAARVQFR